MCHQPAGTSLFEKHIFQPVDCDNQQLKSLCQVVTMQKRGIFTCAVFLELSRSLPFTYRVPHTYRCTEPGCPCRLHIHGSFIMLRINTLLKAFFTSIVLLAVMAQSGSVSAGSQFWSAHGPEGGDIRALVIDPKKPTTLYAGTERGGLFKSTNGGDNWKPVNTGLTNEDVEALAIDPERPEILYAGTWGSGVFKSVDGGESWSAVNSGMTNPYYSGAYVTSLAIDPDQPDTLYAGTAEGMYRSFSGGNIWEAVNTGLTNNRVKALAINPVTPSVLYAGTEAGVFKSINAGTSWTACNIGLTNTYVTSLAIDPLTPAILYAGTYGGAFKSIDGGGSWTDINNRDHGHGCPDPGSESIGTNHPVCRSLSG